jgi:hypothetical protein
MGGVAVNFAPEGLNEAMAGPSISKPQA